MMKNTFSLLQYFFLSALLISSCSPTYSTTTPIAPPADIATLMVSLQSSVDGVELSWTDGSAPYIVVRSETPDFSSSTTIIYISRSASSPIDDENVMLDTKTYYYQVYDLNAQPGILSLSASNPIIGDVITIDGYGFDALNTKLYLEGEEIPISSLTASQCQFTVPANAASGYLTVVSSSGVSQPRRFDKYYFKNHTDLNHASVDTNHDAWVAERGTAATSDMIYKVNHTDGSFQNWGTLNECVGLPIDSGGNHYVGNSTSASSNRGTIWKVDSSGTSYTWGNAGTATTDPVYIRALAVDPTSNNPSTLTVYALDGNNTDHSSNIRAVTTTGHYTYLTIGGAIPNPGGLAINTSQHMFYTLSSSIREIDNSQAFVFSYDSSFGINNPAQINVESDTRIWVANKGSNNIIRLSTDSSDRKYLEKISGLSTPQGVAFDHDPAIDPVTGLSKSYIYVSEKTQFSRYRIYDTVWISIKVLNETIAEHSIEDTLGHTAIFPAISREKQEAVIYNDIAKAKEIFKQAGIDLKVRGSIEWINDPNADEDPNFRGIIYDYNTPYLTNEETTLFSSSRSSNPLDINIYYVFGITASQTGQNCLDMKWGETFTNDWISSMDNQTGSAIMICRCGLSRDNETGDECDLERTGKDGALAHEIAHFLMDSAGGEDLTDPDQIKNLMYYIGVATQHDLNADQINNIQTNTDESEFIERF